MVDRVEEQADFLRGQQVADVLSLRDLAEDQSDDFAVGDDRAAAVAGIDRGVDLNPQPADESVDVRPLDPRDDPLGDRYFFAAHRVAVDRDRLLHRGDIGGHRKRRAAVEEGRIVNLENRHVHHRRDGRHLRRHAVGRLVRLDENLTGVLDDVGVGENAIPIEDEPRTADFLGIALVPWDGRNRVGGWSSGF